MADAYRKVCRSTLNLLLDDDQRAAVEECADLYSRMAEDSEFDLVEMLKLQPTRFRNSMRPAQVRVAKLASEQSLPEAPLLVTAKELSDTMLFQVPLKPKNEP